MPSVQNAPCRCHDHAISLRWELSSRFRQSMWFLLTLTLLLVGTLALLSGQWAMFVLECQENFWKRLSMDLIDWHVSPGGVTCEMQSSKGHQTGYVSELYLPMLPTLVASFGLFLALVMTLVAAYRNHKAWKELKQDNQHMED